MHSFYQLRKRPPCQSKRRIFPKCRFIVIVYTKFSVVLTFENFWWSTSKESTLRVPPAEILKNAAQNSLYIELSVELTFENMYQPISKQNALQGLPANTGAAMVQILKSPLCSWFYIVHVVMRRFSKFMKLAWSLRDLRATTAPLRYRFSKVSSAVALCSKLIC